MVIRITVEAIVYSLLYTAFMLVLFRIQGAKYQLYNYPPAIKARAIEKGITTQAELDDIFSAQNLMHPAYKAKRYTDESEQ